MKSVSIGCVVAAAVLASAVPVAQAAVEPPRDAAIGDGSVVQTTYHFDVSSGPSGEMPTGSASIGGVFNPPLTSDEILCLSVTANTATFVYRILPGLDFAAAKVTAVDGATGDIVAFMVYDQFTPVPTCSTPITDFEGNGGQLPAQIAGQIVVHDALPFPSSKAECKNGGWRSFSGFKNQGDCVSFVATKGKNPPGGY